MNQSEQNPLNGACNRKIPESGSESGRSCREGALGGAGSRCVHFGFDRFIVFIHFPKFVSKTIDRRGERAQAFNPVTPVHSMKGPLSWDRVAASDKAALSKTAQYFCNPKEAGDLASSFCSGCLPRDFNVRGLRDQHGKESGMHSRESGDFLPKFLTCRKLQGVSKNSFLLVLTLIAQLAPGELQANGNIVAWGANYYGQTEVPSGMDSVIAIASGSSSFHCLAIQSNSTVLAWGQNFYGQTNVPVGLGDVIAVAAGEGHSLALRSNGTVAAWGDNSNSQTNVPVGVSNIVAIAAGAQHNLALRSDGTIVGWGNNAYGQRSTTGLTGILAISAGASHSLALRSNGTVVAWGRNNYGQTNVPAGLQGVMAIAAGRDHNIALKSNGNVVAWGYYYSGVTNIPLGLSNIAGIAAGAGHSLALKANGQVIAWGSGATNVPAGLSNSFAVAAGSAHSLALSGEPVLKTSPLSQTVSVGSTVEFHVSASGRTPFNYFWLFNSSVITGETNSVLRLTDVQETQSGSYQVVVTNIFGSVTSPPAYLLVTARPAILSQPTNQQAWPDSVASFSVSAVGALPLNYQWRYGEAAISGATNPFLQLLNVQFTNAGRYSVVITNAYGSVTSTPAYLDVYPPTTVFTPSEAALRAAMASGQTVRFACDGTIILTSTITNNVNTTLDASGHQITISGGNAVRAFYINTNLNFRVVNLTIANGASLAGSAILNLGGTVELFGVTFRSNSAIATTSFDQLVPQGSGGAILSWNGVVSAQGCSFVGNLARSPGAATCWFHEEVYGGAIRSQGGQLDLRSCVFSGNLASGGSGSDINVCPGGLPGDPALGGAIHNSGTANLDLCVFNGNSAKGGGGLEGYPFRRAGGPAGDGSGGAIFNQGNMTIERSSFSNNSASGGRGGAGGTDTVTLDGYVGGKGATAYGGAIYNAGSLSLSSSTVASNAAAGGSGGTGGAGMSVDMQYSGGDGAQGGDGDFGRGGAMFNTGSAGLVNCTIAFNTGTGGDGGNGGAGAPSYHNAGNGGNGGNGSSGFGGVEGTCNLVNCTLAYNRGIAGLGGIGGAASQSSDVPGIPGTNGTGGTAWGGTVCGMLPNTLIVSNSPPGGDTLADARLGPLADNGGPTYTMALLAGSAAIDAGNTAAAPAADQRGITRPFGIAADIGAYEYAPMLSISRNQGSALDILLRDGNPGQTCRLLTSTTLSSWVCVATNQIGTNGMFLFQQSCDTAEPLRFYKTLLP